ASWAAPGDSWRVAATPVYRVNAGDGNRGDHEPSGADPRHNGRHRRGLRGRRKERDALERLLELAREGRSSVLVLRGDPGVGKTALLDYAADRASGFRVARAGGVESEMELAFAGLQQLCAPMLDRL